MDYVDDLASFSPADVRLACAQWRKSDDNHMPTPGQIIAKCRSLVSPSYQPRIEPPPERPQFSEEHKAKVKAALQALSGELANKMRLRGPIERRPGETEAEQARRLWPSHEVKPR